MRNKSRVIIAIIFSFLVMFGTFSNIFAAYENSNIELGDYTIKATKIEERYITYDTRPQRLYKYYYMDINGIKTPAYCFDLGADGAELGEYNVEVNSKLDDKVLTNIIFNGYPYQNPNVYDPLLTVDEAQYATQFAIWAYKNKLDLNKISPMKPEYSRVVNAIKKIYTNGTTGQLPDNTVKLIEVDKEFKIDELDSNYYSKRYKTEFDNSMVNDIRVQDSKNLIRISDLQNKELDNLCTVKEIKILIPRYKIKEYMKISFNIIANVKQNVVMFGKTKVEKKQNTLMTLKPEKQDIINLDLNINYKPTNLRIIKVDKENNEIKIPNTKFKIYNKTKEKFYGEYTTDENGEIFIDAKKDFNIFNDDEEIVIQESQSNQDYYIDKENNEFVVKLKTEQDNVINIENEKIKGKIKIFKTSKNYNKLSKLDKGSPLEGTVFNIFNDKGDIVDTVTTNNEGIAISKDLLKGKYYIKEIKSSKFYVLDSNIYEVEIKEHNKELEVNITNDNVEYTKELPNTGL